MRLFYWQRYGSRFPAVAASLSCREAFDLNSISNQHFNQVRSFRLFTTQFVSTKPPSNFHEIFPKTQRDSQKFNENTVCETLSCYGSNWKEAEEFFTWVSEGGKFIHTTATYNRMIDISGKYFEFDNCWELIKRMKENPNSFPNHITFRTMFKRYVSAHLVQEAIDTYDRLDEFNLKDYKSYCNLIDALCEYKHVVEAYEFCFERNKDMDLQVKDTKIYNMILRGWFQIGWWGKCKEFWIEMDTKGVQKDLHSYSIFMDIQCKSGKPWKAVSLYNELKRRSIKLDTVAYNTVVRAIGRSRGVDFALRVLREMKELGCEPNVVTYNTIIKLLCENGRMDDAYKKLEEMQKRGKEPDVITYHCFFSCLEDPKMILRLFDKMFENGVRPRMDTYVMLLRKFGRWGFLRPIFIIWKKMEEGGLKPDEFAYNAMIDALVQRGLIDEARKYQEEMLAAGLFTKLRKELAEDIDLEGPVGV